MSQESNVNSNSDVGEFDEITYKGKDYFVDEDDIVLDMTGDGIFIPVGKLISRDPIEIDFSGAKHLELNVDYETDENSGMESEEDEDEPLDVQLSKTKKDDIKKKKQPSPILEEGEEIEYPESDEDEEDDDEEDEEDIEFFDVEYQGKPYTVDEENDVFEVTATGEYKYVGILVSKIPLRINFFVEYYGKSYLVNEATKNILDKKTKQIIGKRFGQNPLKIVFFIPVEPVEPMIKISQTLSIDKKKDVYEGTKQVGILVKIDNALRNAIELKQNAITMIGSYQVVLIGENVYVLFNKIPSSELEFIHQLRHTEGLREEVKKELAKKKGILPGPSIPQKTPPVQIKPAEPTKATPVQIKPAEPTKATPVQVKPVEPTKPVTKPTVTPSKPVAAPVKPLVATCKPISGTEHYKTTQTDTKSKSSLDPSRISFDEPSKKVEVKKAEEEDEDTVDMTEIEYLGKQYVLDATTKEVYEKDPKTDDYHLVGKQNSTGKVQFTKKADWTDEYEDIEPMTYKEKEYMVNPKTRNVFLFNKELDEYEYVGEAVQLKPLMIKFEKVEQSEEPEYSADSVFDYEDLIYKTPFEIKKVCDSQSDWQAKACNRILELTQNMVNIENSMEPISVLMTGYENGPLVKPAIMKLKKRLADMKIGIDKYVFNADGSKNLEKDKNYSATSAILDQFANYKHTFPKSTMPYATNAFLKMWEMIYTHTLIPKEHGDEYTVFGNAEFPGAFIFAIHHYITKKTDNPNYKWYGNSLYPDKDIVLGDYFGLYQQHKQNWLMDGKKYSGNVLDLKMIDHIYTELGNKVDLYTSDIGIPLQESEFNQQEELEANLNLGQVISGLVSLKRGGHMVCKMFLFFTPFNMSLLYVLTQLFDEFYVTKPVTSRPGNSEIYIIGKGYKGYDESKVNPLKQALLGWNKKSVDKPLCSIPEDFAIRLLEAAYIVYERQIRFIQMNIQITKKMDEYKEFSRSSNYRQMLEETQKNMSNLKHRVDLNTGIGQKQKIYVDYELADRIKMVDKWKQRFEDGVLRQPLSIPLVNLEEARISLSKVEQKSEDLSISSNPILPIKPKVGPPKSKEVPVAVEAVKEPKVVEVKESLELEESESESDDEMIEVEIVESHGKKFIKDGENNIYEPKQFEIIGTWNNSDQEIDYIPLRAFINQDNSCYLDSVLFALFYRNSSFIDQNILRKDIDGMLRRLRIDKPDVTSALKTNQTELLTIYKWLHHQEQKENSTYLCRNFRAIYKQVSLEKNPKAIRVEGFDKQIGDSAEFLFGLFNGFGIKTLIKETISTAKSDSDMRIINNDIQEIPPIVSVSTKTKPEEYYSNTTSSIDSKGKKFSTVMKMNDSDEEIEKELTGRILIEKSKILLEFFKSKTRVVKQDKARMTGRIEEMEQTKKLSQKQLDEIHQIFDELYTKVLPKELKDLQFETTENIILLQAQLIELQKQYRFEFSEKVDTTEYRTIDGMDHHYIVLSVDRGVQSAKGLVRDKTAFDIKETIMCPKGEPIQLQFVVKYIDSPKHYVCYFKNMEDDLWYLYNDTDKHFRIVSTGLNDKDPGTFEKMKKEVATSCTLLFYNK